MPGAMKKNFDSPDETRTPPMARIAVVNIGGVEAFRMSAEPGWKWSESVKPIAKTDTCQAHHVGTVVSGRMHVSHSDGSELEIEPGDAYVIQPGHDAWVVGEHPFVGFEFDSSTADTFSRGT